MTSTPKPTSAAGGAKYHTLQATALWQAFATAMAANATRPVGERERERRDKEVGEAHNVVNRHD